MIGRVNSGESTHRAKSKPISIIICRSFGFSVPPTSETSVTKGLKISELICLQNMRYTHRLNEFQRTCTLNCEQQFV